MNVTAYKTLIMRRARSNLQFPLITKRGTDGG